jgi:cytochrome oxidase Cu insertion factor (SCO1/SenC/PrrC family)
MLRRLLVCCLLMLALALLPACRSAAPTATATATPAQTPTAAMMPTVTVTATPAPPRLEPASTLARRCDQYQSFAARPMTPGQLAIDFTLKDTAGKAYTLSNLLAEKPVIMIFGSFT